jgi:hypothetical protein
VTHRNVLDTQAKAARAGPGVPPKQCYIRVSVGLPSGCSPGIPYVLEIWPPGHFSPIHNHGNAFGIVRMLHGSITSERPLFPYPVTNPASVCPTPCVLEMRSPGDFSPIHTYGSAFCNVCMLHGSLATERQLLSIAPALLKSCYSNLRWLAQEQHLSS